MKKEYEMTEGQKQAILDAIRPVPMIMLHIAPPRSQQERANDAWEQLGKEMGFKGMSVEPSPRGDNFFFAEPLEPTDA